ncbi:hypothetical protein [Microbacterium neungamense]|uniref:hypothetical protein n=1 Tax=Microbacterium neungamense TaxID=2810535 RepID=UPI00217E3621|nr:hypothetical protein [Microbacterium neungamense]UWF77775.1 hypothetical protein JSY13_01500 [Microbacterium neungamense]
METTGIPKDVLQIVGTRSGAGSTWIEVDLRFTMDLGPVKISGATVRGTWDGGATPTFGIRGFDARIDLPGVVSGGGRFQLGSTAGGQGIDIALWGTLIPLSVGGFLRFELKTVGGVTMHSFGLGLDLPVAVPLGPTGLGLYSVAASFGSNAALKPLDPADPLGSLRRQEPWEGLEVSRGDITIGAGVIIGTVPDAGLTFSALGVLGLTVPDFTLRVGINASLFRTQRLLLADLVRDGAATENTLSLLGGLSATSAAIDLGIEGRYEIPSVVTVRIPVSGHFPFADHSWWLNAGSDGDLSPVKRPPGPLQATVFPGIPALESGGWAFLMIAGNGIPDVAGLGISPTGFSVALGVGFTKTFGVVGVLWARATTSLVAAIGTSPFVVWAQGRLAGEVGIGPFRLGLDALLKIQFVPEQSRLDFHLKVCASVDLWFTTLEGCIELGAIDPAAAPAIVPRDEDWPWPTVVLADGLGRMLPVNDDATFTPPQRTSGDGESGIAAPESWAKTPRVWADAIPLLTFPVAPVQKIPPSPTGEDLTPENGQNNDGMSGAGKTRFQWAMTALQLHEVKPDGTDVAEVELSRAAWQPPAGVSATAGAVSTSRQLALLTRNRWLTKVHADGGASAPDEPLRDVAGLCGLKFTAGRSWTYGMDAQRVPGTADDWHVARRSDALSFSPLRSYARGVGFRVPAPVRIERQPRVAGVDWPSGPIAYASSVPTSFPVDGAVEEEEFAGALRLRSPQSVLWDHEGAYLRCRVEFDEPVEAGDLLLRMRLQGKMEHHGIENFAVTARRSFRVEWPGGSEPIDAVEVGPSPAPDAGPGDALVRVTVPAGKGATAIAWGLPWQATVDVLGLHAMATADAAAAAAAEAGRQAAVAADEASTKASADPAAQRTILKPGSSYRITVSLQWERWTDEGTGTITRTAGTTRTATWFFRVAPRPPAATGGAPWKEASLLGVPEMTLTVDTFRPEYLERYFLDYSIDDHESFVFTGDRPWARFTAPHLAALAAAYRRDLGLLLGRTDIVEDPIWRHLRLVALSGPLGIPDAIATAAEEYGCPMPPRSAGIRWPLRLRPRTPYELAVALPRKGTKATRSSPQLHGITFSTSAFPDPEALVASLGFTRSVFAGNIAAAVPTGHLRVTAAPGLASGLLAVDDALEAALAALGLPPLPPLPVPPTGGAGRSSALWTRAADGGWSVLGILLEASEPLVRDGGRRMDIGDGRVAGRDLSIRRRDRSGTRALWLLPQPLRPTAPMRLRIRVTDRGAPFWMRMTLPVEPAFARSAIVGRSTT